MSTSQADRAHVAAHSGRPGALPEGARFGTVIGIQVYQHGTESEAQAHVRAAIDRVVPGGLFCVRVNGVDTEIDYAHTVLTRSTGSGLTIRYDDGPKRDLLVHFASREELLARARASFTLVAEPWEDVIRRDPPKTGSWAQWEVVWRRNDR